jgi:hypothetical protein
MKLNDIYPSTYLKAADLGDEPMVLTIDRVEMAEMQDGTRKPAAYFEEQEKGLILNRTNANTIAAIYGDDTDSWHGARVQLISVPVEFNGRQVEAIRVRVRQTKPSAKQPHPAAVRAHASGDGQVRSGTASYGEAKGRAPVAPRKSLGEKLEDEIPFAPSWM